MKIEKKAKKLKALLTRASDCTVLLYKDYYDYYIKRLNNVIKNIETIYKQQLQWNSQ